jgi:hypothetical protein
LPEGDWKNLTLAEALGASTAIIAATTAKISRPRRI